MTEQETIFFAFSTSFFLLISQGARLENVVAEGLPGQAHVHQAAPNVLSRSQLWFVILVPSSSAQDQGADVGLHGGEEPPQAPLGRPRPRFRGPVLRLVRSHHRRGARPRSSRLPLPPRGERWTSRGSPGTPSRMSPLGAPPTRRRESGRPLRGLRGLRRRRPR